MARIRPGNASEADGNGDDLLIDYCIQIRSSLLFWPGPRQGSEKGIVNENDRERVLCDTRLGQKQTEKCREIADE